MKIIVIFKWLRNPQDARVGTDGLVDWCGAKMSPNDDDPAAITVAKDLAADSGEIVGLTIADGDVSWAAARGADSTVVVTDAHTEADSAATGAILAAAVHRIGNPDLVLIGDSSWDYGVVSALVGQLGWPALANVVSAKTEGGRLHVTQKVGAVPRVVEVGGSVVLAVAASRAEQQVPGMKQVLAARKKPVTKLTVADLGISPAGKAIFGGTRLPDKPMAKMFDGGDPATAAAQIVAALRMDGVL